jgi:NAD-dependent dihydropyrimidine dehydrogenase PreA subunit
MDEMRIVYRELQQHIDERMHINYPATESGVEIRLLKYLFTPEEAKLVLKLSALPESLKRIHKRVKKDGMSIEELEEKLDILVEKGSILGGKLIAGKKGEKRYSLAPFAIGMFEFQLDKLNKKFMEDTQEYFDGTYYKAFHKTESPCQMRTIPIEKSFTPEHYVSTYDNIRYIIKNKEGSISLMNCICKQGMDVLGKSCKLTDIRKTCITLGNFAEFFIARGLGHEIEKGELFELLQQFEDIGLVLQTENTQNPGFICGCCGDCCEVLKGVKRFPRPTELYSSNYFALVTPEECDGCETCIDRCQMQARSIVDDVSIVDLDRCIGCGNCIPTCPSNASQLQKKEKEKVPPKDTDALFQKIMLKKNGLWGSLKLIGKKILGMQI